LLIIATLAASGVACTRLTPPSGAESTATPTGTATETGQTAATSPGATGTAGSGGTETNGSETSMETVSSESSQTGSASPEIDTSGPDITLFTLPECSVVPGGALSGADALTMLVAVRNGGPGSWNSLVPYRISSDTGLSSQGSSAVSVGSEFTPMQVELSEGDYSRTHHFTITADPDNQIRERDESNNQLAITLALPPRPTGTINLTCTSP
jgi:hypothetical protein